MSRNIAVPASRPRASKPEIIKVRPDVWKEAVKLSQGDPRRIRIISAHKVEILPPR